MRFSRLHSISEAYKVHLLDDELEGFFKLAIVYEAPEQKSALN
jgi:hypothetical protein